jgi:hypothetical protein
MSANDPADIALFQYAGLSRYDAVSSSLEGGMRRRDFITLLGTTAAAWPLAARGQQTKIARIGFLGSDSASSHAVRLAAFRAGLRDLVLIRADEVIE